MGSAGLLIQYQAIRNHSLLMLESARQGDWDRLIELERNRAELHALLQAQEPRSTWPETDQLRKGELIRSILANDAETRKLVEPRWQELQNIFGSLYVEKKLLMAYAMNA